MTTDKHSDLPASERHLGWAISAVLAGAMVRLEAWGPGTHWTLNEVGNIVWDDGATVPLRLLVGENGFYIYEPESEDAPEPTDDERIVALEAECRALRELVNGEFAALSARITEVSRMTQNVGPRATGTIGGVDLSKLR